MWIIIPPFYGNPRLKFPADAPSRSTLKLEEAILTFIPRKEENKRLNENMIGVDLGLALGLDISISQTWFICLCG